MQAQGIVKNGQEYLSLTHWFPNSFDIIFQLPVSKWVYLLEMSSLILLCWVLFKGVNDESRLV